MRELRTVGHSPDGAGAPSFRSAGESGTVCRGSRNVGLLKKNRNVECRIKKARVCPNLTPLSPERGGQGGEFRLVICHVQLFIFVFQFGSVFLKELCLLCFIGKQVVYIGLHLFVADSNL